MNSIVQTLLALATLAATTARVVAAGPQCPPTIDVRQQLTTPVSGWTSLDEDSPYRLANVTFYDGRPQDHVSLVPDTSRKSGDHETSTWQFSLQSDRRVWIACQYGSTSISLAQELSAGTRACTVVYNLRQRVDGLPIVESVNCK
jgi:hypothetical protein